MVVYFVHSSEKKKRVRIVRQDEVFRRIRVLETVH